MFALQAALVHTMDSACESYTVMKPSHPSPSSAIQTHDLPRTSTRRENTEIRSRFLNRVGIKHVSPIKPLVRPTEPTKNVELRKQRSFNVVLKADHGRRDRSLERQMSDSESTLSTSPGGRSVPDKVRPLVNFDASVKVHPIPARSDYSQRMHSSLWTPSLEVSQNVARNTFEFAAEGWDVSGVLDDDQMIIFKGEKVHPIHFLQE